MDKYKISRSEIDSNNVKSAPTHNANEEPRVNKHIFDKLPELIAEKYNMFIDNFKTVVNEMLTEHDMAIGAGDMLKAVYDCDDDGVVDDAKMLDGQPASYYATKTEVETAQAKAEAAMPKSGGTFTGAVTLKADPTANLHPATKQYVDNKTGKDLLWTNASPTSNFGAQTISINLANYGFIIIEHRWTVSDAYIVYDVFSVGKSGLFMRHCRDVNAFRELQTTQTGVTFKTGYAFGSYGNMGTNSNDARLIPTRIWGIK